MLSKIKSVLKKTTQAVKTALNFKKINISELEQLEEELIKADFGVEMTSELLSVTKTAKPSDIGSFVKNYVRDILLGAESNLLTHEQNIKPFVIFVVGVNGNGKTTTVAKLANYFHKNGKKVRIAACDTFRAAAVDQLRIWANRIGCEITTGKENGDPSGVAYAAYKDAESFENDILIIDTAGRLHTRTDLMDELQKIKRVIQKLNDSVPHETVIVLDGTTGQSAFSQIQSFKNSIDIDSVIVTKLDSTSKGGAVVGLVKQYGVAISAICFGEGVDDIQAFSANDYVESIFN